MTRISLFKQMSPRASGYDTSLAIPPDDDASHFIQHRKPDNTNISKAMCSAIILGSYAVRKFTQHLKECDDYENFEYRDDMNGGGVAYALNWFNGLKRTGMRDNYENVNGASKIIRDSIFKWFDLTSGEMKKLKVALFKTLYYSFYRSNIENISIKEYMCRFWHSLAEAIYTDAHDGAELQNYYTCTNIGLQILNGKSNVLKVEEEDLFEYCIRTTVYKEIQNKTTKTFEVKKIGDELQRLSEILSGIRIEDNEILIVLKQNEYREGINENALTLTTLENPLNNKNEELIKIPKPEDELMPFIDFQHEKLHLKRLLCTSVEKLTEQYVDLSCDEDNSIHDTVISMLNEKKSVLVYGSGGMGKSTLSYIVYEQLYKEYKRNTSNIAPIIVSPRVFMDEGLTASNIIDLTVRDCNTELSQNVVCDPHRVVLFIDAIDEYFKPESEGLEKLVLYTKEYTKFVTGRTEVSRSIAYAFKSKPIDLKNAIDETLFEKIYRQYSENCSNFDEIHEFITQLKDLESTPLVAAMIATFLSKNSITYVNGKPVRGALYNDLVSKMVLDKLGTINRACSTEMSLHAAMNILSEYAWTRYRWPIKNYEDRLDLVSHKAHYNKQSCRALLNEFTESDGMEDRLFLHMSIQDYLVAKWVVRQSSAKKIDDEFLNIMFRTDVQRFVGDFMKLSPDLAVQITSFCIKVIRNCDSICDESLKNNYQFKMIYLLTRGAFVGNRRAASDINAYLYQVVKDNKTSPQLAMALLCVTMLSDMREEERYYQRLLNDDRFAEIARILYLVYEGDIDSMNLELRDTNGSFENVAQRYLEDVGEYNLRDDRCKYLCRTQTLLVKMLLENGYYASRELIIRISSIITGDVLNWIFDEPFEKNLIRCGINPEEYRRWLSSDIDQLRKVAQSMIE